MWNIVNQRRTIWEDKENEPPPPLEKFLFTPLMWIGMNKNMKTQKGLPTLLDVKTFFTHFHEEIRTPLSSSEDAQVII